MGEVIGILVLLGVLYGIGRIMLAVAGWSFPLAGDPLDDARVEWSVSEGTGSSGGTVWNWAVRVGDKGSGNYDFSRFAATNNARNAARRLIGEGKTFGKTRACPLCSKPARMGKETDTDDCARLLDSARAELPKAVL